MYDMSLQKLELHYIITTSLVKKRTCKETSVNNVFPWNYNTNCNRIIVPWYFIVAFSDSCKVKIAMNHYFNQCNDTCFTLLSIDLAHLRGFNELRCNNGRAKDSGKFTQLLDYMYIDEPGFIVIQECIIQIIH